MQTRIFQSRLFITIEIANPSLSFVFYFADIHTAGIVDV